MPENPYDSPKGLHDVAPEVEPPRKPSWGRGGAIVLMVLSIPAALVAFVTVWVCGATFVFTDLMELGNTQNWLFFGVGGIGGVLAFSAMIWAAKRMGKGK